MNARPYSQAVSWPGTTCEADQGDEFAKFIAEEFNGARAKFIGCFLTKPDIDQFGENIPDTGGRSDLCFYIHEDDVNKFAVARFRFGMRWIDDVIANENHRSRGTIYSPEFHALKSWSDDKSTPSPMNEDDEYHEDGSEAGCAGE